jgi:hypothetical protein
LSYFITNFTTLGIGFVAGAVTAVAVPRVGAAALALLAKYKAWRAARATQ